ECEGAPLSWLYSPLLTRPISRTMDQSRRLNGSNCEAALKIVDELSPRQAYVYAMGQEPWTGFIMNVNYDEASAPIVESTQFIETCRARGMQSERLFAQKEFVL